MSLFEGLMLITSIHILAAASPGPDFILVSQQTLANGKKAGVMCSIGIALGLSVHIIYSALGLAAVIASSEIALWVIKLLGGFYLLYLGLQCVKIKAIKPYEEKVNVSHASVQRSYLKMVGLGFLCNALNPKAPIYFVALFTIVLSPDMPFVHIVIYGLWMMLIQLVWFTCVALLLSQPRINLAFQSFSHWLNRILGSAMILMGLKVLLTKIN